jgi:hypothetical protein
MSGHDYDDWIGPPIPRDSWTMELEPVPTGEPDETVESVPWIGIVECGDRRPARIYVCLSPEQIDDLDSLDHRPLEFLISQTTPRDPSGPPGAIIIP